MFETLPKDLNSSLTKDTGSSLTKHPCLYGRFTNQRAHLEIILGRVPYFQDCYQRQSQSLITNAKFFSVVSHTINSRVLTENEFIRTERLQRKPSARIFFAMADSAKLFVSVDGGTPREQPTWNVYTFLDRWQEQKGDVFYRGWFVERYADTVKRGYGVHAN